MEKKLSSLLRLPSSLKTLSALILTSSIFLLTSSCSNYKDIPYFQNAAEYMTQQSSNKSAQSASSAISVSSKGTTANSEGTLYEMRIKPKDLLSIFVFSSDEEAVAQFNISSPQPINIASTKNRISMPVQFQQYMVDNTGNIDFPIVGKVKLKGLTIPEANSIIKSEIVKYFKDENDCLVNVYIDNYEVTVMGEVKSPNTFTTNRNKMTVLEALAKAGDMTIYGRRDCVKILREKSDGEYEVHELDMRDANILNSPYYYLQRKRSF